MFNYDIAEPKGRGKSSKLSKKRFVILIHKWLGFSQKTGTTNAKHVKDNHHSRKEPTLQSTGQIIKSQKNLFTEELMS